uniref:Uncharacterized protein n=1 Tax=Caenorhabditis japonica TaxID=281687 RepID=A0A8R1E8G7_CAEJA
MGNFFDWFSIDTGMKKQEENPEKIDTCAPYNLDKIAEKNDGEKKIEEVLIEIEQFIVGVFKQVFFVSAAVFGITAAVYRIFV